jgi:uncharacterized membrane protein
VQDVVNRPVHSYQSTGTYNERESSDDSSNRLATLLGSTVVAVSGAVLAAYAFKQRSWPAAGAALATPLVYRSATGRWPVPEAVANKVTEVPAPIEASVTIDRPAHQLFAYWRQFENLPRFMEHLESVTDLGNGRSRWVARSPLGFQVEWEAEILEEREGQILSWRSLPGAQVHNAGSVLFEDATGGRGTIVHAVFELQPAGAFLGRALGRVLNPLTKHQVKEDLRRFKQLMEAGELPTTDGQSAGHRPMINIHNPL